MSIITHSKQRFLFPDLTVNNYKNSLANKVQTHDLPIHGWYRFVLSFPPHLVREYMARFDLRNDQTLLDPFCGTGTTLVESKRQGISGIGIEANQMAYFASMVKCDWDISVPLFLEDTQKVLSESAKQISSASKMLNFSPEEESLVLKNSIESELLHKTLILRNMILENNSVFRNHQLLALATSTVRYCSRLHFGPEVGVSLRKKCHSDVLYCWWKIIQTMGNDLNDVSIRRSKTKHQMILGDARDISSMLQKNSVDAVFTSPPYPNEKDYTRTTRLESVLLGFISNKHELRQMKENLLRSNSRNIYKDDSDDSFVAQNKCVTRIADEIEEKRLALGKTSGFEKQYHRIVRHYFGGMARHLENLIPCLKKGAFLGYLVGDQASFFQVHIPTGEILAKIAYNLGYTVESINLFRTRLATATGKQMKEEVVILKWNN